MSVGLVPTQPVSAGPLSAGSLAALADGYRLAAIAMAEMQQHRILPTPHAYELWLAYRTHADPALTERVATLLDTPGALTPAAIAALRLEFGIGTRQPDQDADPSATLHDIARILLASARPILAALAAPPELALEDQDALSARLAAAVQRLERLEKTFCADPTTASTDPLTGLATGAELEARLQQTRRKLAADPDTPASLLLLDIDHFRRLTDTYGRRVGDRVLRLVGRLLIESIKGRDLAARCGTDDFAIVLVGADRPAAAKVARQIGATLAQKRVALSNGSEQGHGRVTLSIGVTQFHPDDSATSVVERAEAALRAAKHAGRNRVMTDLELRAPLM